jgi:hypothetical protein
MAKTVYAVFENLDQTETALGQLVRKGFGRDQVEVQSSEPFLDRRLLVSADEQKTRVSWFIILGGMAGAAAGFSLAAATFTWMNLPTGGMPMIPFGPTGIVVFESTALGAIFGAILMLLVEGGLARRAQTEAAEFASEIADGGLLVCVQCQTDDQVVVVSDLMKDLGAERVKG